MTVVDIGVVNPLIGQLTEEHEDKTLQNYDWFSHYQS